MKHSNTISTVYTSWQMVSTVYTMVTPYVKPDSTSGKWLEKITTADNKHPVREK